MILKQDPTTNELFFGACRAGLTMLISHDRVGLSDVPLPVDAQDPLRREIFLEINLPPEGLKLPPQLPGIQLQLIVLKPGKRSAG